jgi:hypothetical protein
MQEKDPRFPNGHGEVFTQEPLRKKTFRNGICFQSLRDVVFDPNKKKKKRILIV